MTRVRNRPRRTRWLIAAVLVAGLALVAWRWAPRPATPPTSAMREASSAAMALEASQSPPPEPPADPTSDRERLLVAAFALRGKPYEWGAKGPDTYDCSGFTKAAYEAIGVSLPDGSFNQAVGEQPLESPDDLVAGDLLFYRWAGSDGVTHVTMYAGNGWVIGTGSPGQPKEVVLYPLADDLVDDGRVITHRHIELDAE